MKLIDGGSDAGRLNLVALAEGYLGTDRGLFDDHAKQLAAQLERESWYRRGLLNLHAVFVASRERAPTAPDGKPHDTAFKSYYGGDRAAHVISGDDETARTYVTEHFPPGASTLGEIAVPRHIIVLTNSTLYGGRGGGKGGGLCWSYTDIRNPARWTACALHELGHSLFGLADEYGGIAPPVSSRTREPTEPNITLDPRGGKWRHLVAGATEGADGYDRGIYRPTRNCRMRSFTEPFCAVCADAARRTLEGYLTETDDAPPQASAGHGLKGELRVQYATEERWFDDDSAGALEAQQWILRRQFG